MNTSTRPVSIPHLVLGLIFAGGALVWLIAEATSADLPHAAIGFPAVLIGAGVAGLIASLVNARNRKRVPAQAPAGAETEETDQTEPTTVIEEN
jgi:hypothetical protein